MNRLTIARWLLAGITGSVVFWLVQLLSGGPTIPDFMGEQIVAGGGYPKGLTPLVGWAVHLGVGLSYASLLAVIVLLLRAMTFRARAALAFFAALVLGYLTALIAPPAISVTIALLSGQGWPAELYPLNTEFGLPFWNHVIFFLLNWVIQGVGPRLRLSSRGGIPAVVAVSLLLSGCVREMGPEDVALEYGRALYASDSEKIYRLISAEDRLAKDEDTFRQQQSPPPAAAVQVLRQLATFITSAPVEKTIAGRRATVKLRFRLPDANAPEIRTLAQEWDERRLAALSETGRAEISERLDQLHRTQKLPMLEGEETIELVKEDSGWRVFLNWAGGVRVSFGAAVDPTSRLQVTVSPAQISVTPGERIRVTVRATNRASRDVTTRVGHRIEPKAEANFLALLQCHLFLPVTLKPGETNEFISEYLLLRDVPDQVKNFEVLYEFPAPSRS